MPFLLPNQTIYIYIAQKSKIESASNLEGSEPRSTACETETTMYLYQLRQQAAISVGRVVNVQCKPECSHHGTNRDQVLEKPFQPTPIAGVAQVSALMSGDLDGDAACGK